MKRLVVVMTLTLFWMGHIVSAEGTTVLGKLSMVQEMKQLPMKFNGQERKVAYLTIDDGPSKVSEQLVDILAESNVKATFFLIGTNVKNNEKIIKRMYDEGHYVGMHSISHNYNMLYNEGELIDEMLQLQGEIEEITGHKSTLFRCPYGTVPGMQNEVLKKNAIDEGLKTWDWTIDSNDWRYQDNPQAIVKEISSQLTENVEVILIHDKRGTVEVLPQIIAAIKSKGYEFEVYDESRHFPMNFLNDIHL